MYTVMPYYIAKVVMELPMSFILPMISEIIIYFGVGLTVTASQFFYFYLILYMLMFCSSSMGYLLSSIFTNAEAAAGLAPIVIMPFMLFSGFFANAGSYPAWIGWL